MIFSCCWPLTVFRRGGDLAPARRATSVRSERRLLPAAALDCDRHGVTLLDGVRCRTDCGFEGRFLGVIRAGHLAVVLDAPRAVVAADPVCCECHGSPPEHAACAAGVRAAMVRRRGSASAIS